MAFHGTQASIAIRKIIWAIRLRIGAVNYN